MKDYLEYLSKKRQSARPIGFDVELSELHPLLFDWQKLAVKWSLSLGRAALFEERGLGKTVQQIEWGKQVQVYTHKPVLIVCPLAVARQTIREAQKVDTEITYVRSMDEVKRADTPLFIINYDMLDQLDPAYFGGLVLDESSILKAYTGKTKQFILERFAPAIAYRLFCTATPAPNDVMELGNHAKGLGVMESSTAIVTGKQIGRAHV